MHCPIKQTETHDREIYDNDVKGFPALAYLFHQCGIRSGAMTMNVLWQNMRSSSTKWLFWIMLSATMLLFTDPTHAQLEYPGKVDILGSEEVVFRWSTDSCSTDNIPDTPLRLFRDAEGNIQVILGHYTNYRLVGPDFNSLTPDCNNGPVMNSHYDSDPAQFNDYEWIAATYTLDGKTIYAILHNEYHGNEYPNQVSCPSGEYQKCWYNALTFAVSSDSGKTYTHAPAPDHLLAAAPYQYVPDGGPAGIFGGSNIVYNPADGYYYALIHLEAIGQQQTGVSVMRTQNLADPASWRAWDGTGYTVQFINPYRDTTAVPDDHIAAIIGDGNIEKMVASLTWNTYFQKWLLVGAAQKNKVWGIYYSLSDDLIHWSVRKRILAGNMLVDPNADPTQVRLAYPAVVDHADTSRNFEITGQDVYLYYVKIYPGNVLDRELVRVPIRFNKLLVTGFTVTGKGDLEDTNPGDGVCKTSAGLCSFRAALMESNARPTWLADSLLRIHFDLAQNRPVTINLKSALPASRYPVYIDGFSQPNALPNSNGFIQGINAQPVIEINGNGNAGLVLNGGNSTVRGLILNRQLGAALTIQSDSNQVEGCFLNVDYSGSTLLSGSNPGIQIIGGSFNRIGGTTAAARNLILGGVDIIGPNARDNVVQGNYIGTNAAGTAGLDTWGNGVSLSAGAQNNLIGGTEPAARNLISGNSRNGIELRDSTTTGNQILNNFIGTDPAGTQAVANGSPGVTLSNGAHQNVIGKPDAGNVISGNSGGGIWLDGAFQNTIQANWIGTDTTGTLDLGNQGPGLYMLGPVHSTTVGGANAGEGNVFAFNDDGGVVMLGNVKTGNRILGNRFYANDQRSGIDLGYDGHTWNDAGDTDTGPNDWQNAPELQSAVAGVLQVTGSLNSLPNTTFRIEFFASDSCDPSGYGEGKTFLEARDVTTDAAGNAAFSLTLNTVVQPGQVITATATDPGGNTSEFSNCVQAKQAAEFTVTPDSISKTVNLGLSAQDTVTITNRGSHMHTWKLSWQAAWLAASGDSGQIAGGQQVKVAVTLNAAGLAAGMYRDTLAVSLPDSGATIKRIPVGLKVTAEPDIVILPDTVRMQAQVGQKDTTALRIVNAGSATLTWTVGWDFQSQWLFIPQKNGATPPGDTSEVTVIANAGNLSAGTHQGVLIVNSNDPDEASLDIPVIFEVTDQAVQQPDVIVTPTEFQVAVFAGDSTADSLFIENRGNAPLDWALQHAADWISPGLQSGSLAPGQKTGVKIGFQAGNLQPGVYRDTLQVQSNDPLKPDVAVPVQMEVAAGSKPQIAVQPDSFRFWLAPGEIDSAQWFIRNTGTAELNWRIDGALPTWLRLSDTTGAVQPGDSATVRLWAQAADSAAGEIHATLTIESNDPQKPQWPVLVALVVYDPATAFRVEPPEITFRLAVGDSSEAAVWLYNQAPTAADWQAAAAAPWLRLSSTQGRLHAGDSVRVSVMCLAAGIQPGVYNDTLRIAIQAAGGLQRQIPVQLTVTGPSSARDGAAVPATFALLQNYPNPFNPETVIRFALPVSAEISLTIYEVTGRRIRRLMEGRQNAGWHTVVWDGRDDHGQAVGSGIYLYTLLWHSPSGQSYKITRKMILMK